MKSKSFEATPLAMTQEYFSKSFSLVKKHVGTEDDYVERKTITVVARSAGEVRVIVFRTFQNIDDDHLTPDGERSLMVGDLIRVIGDDHVSMHRVDMVGFSQVDGFSTGDE